MKLIDLIYFISYKAYIRKNKNNKFGVFTLLALWMAILQVIIFYNVSLLIGLSSDINIMEHTTQKSHIALLGLFFIMNNFYIYFGNRKDIILQRFEHLGALKERKYWYILVVFFIVIWILFGALTVINENS